MVTKALLRDTPDLTMEGASERLRDETLAFAPPRFRIVPRSPVSTNAIEGIVRLDVLSKAEAAALQVVRRPGVMGGSPIIARTRIRVSDIVLHWRQEGRSIAGVRRAIPELSPEQISAALVYYRNHRPEIDREIAAAARWRSSS